MPRQFVPWKNWTRVTVPSASEALAPRPTLEPATKKALLAGLVSVTLGRASTVTLMTPEVATKPPLSLATAVRT